MAVRGLTDHRGQRIAEMNDGATRR
ncbi:hypothetical protein OIHEL45_14989 [Sulfitobacter indolifex HEL-45]|uniref:Uncharacterized protein n=1 Tax=Sulfitobacter indolifex HEL-45 TaxID=391624 RepID=A0ABP2D7M3_9RHOB|nr:hypothetical protein OIHEL45_14989 [Sulfitobacter indolifex HEL-45]